MKGPSVARGAVSLPRGLARGRARKSWPPVSGTGGAGGSHPPGRCARPSVPAEPPVRGSPACRPGPCSPRGRAVRHPVRPRLHGGVMKHARRSGESFAAPAKAGTAPGQPGGYGKNRVPRPENGKPAAPFPRGPGQRQPARRTSSPGAPPAMPPQLTPPGSAVRYPARRVRGGTGHGVATAAGQALQEVTGKPGSRRFPVTVTQLPVTRCQICHHTIACLPGKPALP